MTIDQHILQMEHIYQSMLAKAHTNVKKSQVSQQRYCNMQTSNNPFEVGKKVLKKNMVNDSCKVKMKTKWTGPYMIVEVPVMRDINSRINMAIF